MTQANNTNNNSPMVTKTNWQDFLEHIQMIISTLQQSRDMDLVVMLGNTGVGKSTTINLIKGVPLSLDENGNLSANPDQEVFCKIGDDPRNSCTVLPQIVPLKEGFSLIDIPGFMHTKEDEKSAIDTTIPLVLQHSNINGFILVMEYNSIGVNKGQDLKDIMQRLGELVPKEVLADRILFVVTKAMLPNQRIHREIRLFAKDTIGEDLITDDNVFIVRAEDKPNVAELKQAILNLEYKSTLTKKDFPVPAVKNNNISDFRDLSIEIKASLKKYSEKTSAKNKDSMTIRVTQDLYEAIINTTTGLHRIATHELHVPNLQLILGGKLKLALSDYFANYCSTACYIDELDTEALKEIVIYIAMLRKLMATHFSNCADQLQYYDSLIQSVNNFLSVQQKIKTGSIPYFATKQRNFPPSSNALVRLRHAQRDVLLEPTYPKFTGSDFPQTKNASLLNMLERAVRSTLDLHGFVGWLLAYQAQHYNSANSMILSMLAKEMVNMERIGKLYGSNVDPKDFIINQIFSMINLNSDRLSKLRSDENFFEKITNEYYHTLNDVFAAQKKYIDQYNHDLKQALDARYAGGQNRIPADLNVLNAVETFTAQFNGKTINRLHGGFSSRAIENRYGATDCILNLPAANFFSYMNGRIPGEILAAEYCNLMSFYRAWQTAETYHPHIAYERRGHAARVAIESLQPNVRHVGDTYSAFYNRHWIDGSLDFTIPIRITASIMGAAPQDFYDVTFSGSYTDIAVGADGWLRGHEHISDPGGHGGYHHKMKNALAPHVRSKWSNNLLNVNLSNYRQNPPSVNAWFLEHRTIVGNALINFFEKGAFPHQGAEYRKQLLKEYEAQVLQISICTALIKAFAKLAGKKIGVANINSLTTYDSLRAEINSNFPNTTAHELTPSLAEQLRAKRLVSEKILSLPDDIDLDHPIEILRSTKNILAGHQVWRTGQLDLPFVKSIRPAKDLKLQDYIDSISENERRIDIENSDLSMLQATALAVKMRGCLQLRNITISNCQQNAEQMWMLLGSLADHPQLNNLDISCNPIDDNAAQSDNFRKSLDSIVNKNRLINLNLSNTQINDKTLGVLINALLSDKRLRTLNLMDISACSDATGLNILAMLYVNTTLENILISASSINPIISDAIAYILQYKRENASEIPEELSERLIHMDIVLTEFLNKHKPFTSYLDYHFEIFSRTDFGTFTLSELVRKLIANKKHSNSSPLVHMFTARTERVAKPAAIETKQSNHTYTNNVQHLANVDYMYEDMDITAILLARVAETPNLIPLLQSGRLQVLATADGREPGVLENMIINNRAKFPQDCTMLIPYNLGGNHWLGLLLEFSGNTIKRALYTNSLGHGDFADIQQRLKNLYPDLKLENVQLMQQADGTSCGAYTVENLILLASGQNCPQQTPNSIEVRTQHLTSLRNHRPDYYAGFYQRQLNNEISFHINPKRLAL